MADFKKLPKVVTPRGTAVGWQSLNEPDTKFKAEGVYKTTLAFDADDPAIVALGAQVDQLIDEKHSEMVAQLTADGKGGVARKITKRALDDHFKAEEDPETGEETGRVLLTAKMNASGISKKNNKPWTRSPGIFDAKGKKLTRPPIIGAGSELKLSIELSPYYTAKDKEVGVSFRLEAAQVLKLVSRGARDAAGYGFGEEEGDEIDDLDEGGSDFGANTSGTDSDDDEL